MSTNNKSIQILRGTTSNSSNVVLQPGQPFYDKTDHSFKVGQAGGITPVSGTPRITAGALQLDHALATNLSIYADNGNIIIKNTSSGKKIQLNSPTTEITGDLTPSATGKNIGESNNKFNNIYTDNLLSSSIHTSTIYVGEYGEISIDASDPDHPNFKIMQTESAEGDLTLQSNRYINLNNPSIINSTLNVIGMSTFNGINNGSDGISDAGAISGVTTLTTSNTATIGGNIVPASSSAQGTGKLIGTTINRWAAVYANQVHTQSIEGQNSGWTSNPWSISQEGNIITDGYINVKEEDTIYDNTQTRTINVGSHRGVYVIWFRAVNESVQIVAATSDTQMTAFFGTAGSTTYHVFSNKDNDNYIFTIDIAGGYFKGYCPLIYFHGENNNIENNTASSGSGGNNQAPGGSGTNVPL